MNAPTLPLNSIATRAAPSPRVAVSVLPPLSRAGSGDGLTPTQRRVMIAAIVAAHAAGAWGLMQISAVREAVLEAAPMFVDLIAPPAPPAPPVPPPPKPEPIVKKAPPPLRYDGFVLSLDLLFLIGAVELRDGLLVRGES